jgi:hypothetical protein
MNIIDHYKIFCISLSAVGCIVYPMLLMTINWDRCQDLFNGIILLGCSSLLNFITFMVKPYDQYNKHCYQWPETIIVFPYAIIILLRSIGFVSAGLSIKKSICMTESISVLSIEGIFIILCICLVVRYFEYLRRPNICDQTYQYVEPNDV